MIGKALYALLAADATLTGLVGTRIYPWPLPQGNTFPAIAHVVEEKPVMRCDGGTRIVKAEVMVGIFAENLLTAENIGVHVVRILDTYVGTAGGVDVQSMMLINGTDDFDEELRKHYVKQTYNITILT